MHNCMTGGPVSEMALTFCNQCLSKMTTCNQQAKESYSDRQRALKWVLLVTVPQTVLDATASVLTRLGNAAAQLVLRTHPVGSVVRRYIYYGP